MMTFKSISASAFLLCAVAFMGGCKSVPLDQAQTNIGVYQFGEFRALVNTTAPITTDATRQALKALGLFETGYEADKFEARMTARTTSDDRVIIRIQEVNSRQTMIRIRWSEGGNLPNSRQLYDAIDAIVAAGQH